MTMTYLRRALQVLDLAGVVPDEDPLKIKLISDAFIDIDTALAEFPDPDVLFPDDDTHKAVKELRN